MRRLFARITMVFGALIILVGGGGLLWLQQSLPQAQGSRVLSGLGAEVTVLRDAHGTPTIQAQTMADAYRALGFLHAQDRLWQMEMSRRFGRGSLSEVAGSSTLRLDRFARTLGLVDISTRQLRRLDQPTRAALDAYAAGVNGFLSSNDAPLPPEFLLTGITPDPWSPVDSLLWGKLMALQLSGDWRHELQKSRLLQYLPPERVGQLMPSYSDSPPSLSADEIARAGTAPARLAQVTDPPAALSAESASNAWAIAGSRTASGAPILANDPHLGLRLPATWYLARVETPDLTLTGATAPGVPFHILGHNGTAAWGLTTTHADTMDLVALTPDPDAPDHRYMTPEGSRLYRSETVKIPLRGGEVELFERRTTHFGPVLPDQSRKVALQWTALRESDGTPAALYHLNRARTADDFAAAARLFDAPIQNLFWASDDGTIASAVVGRLPVRSPSRNGALPRTSDATDAPWLGVTDRADTPIVINPADGMIANANNRILSDAATPYPIARDWAPPYRYARVAEMLADARAHTSDDSAAVQLDVLSTFARRLTPLLLRAEPTTAAAQEALAILGQWDYRMTREAAAPAIFSATADALARALAEDDLGPAFKSWWRAEPGFLIDALRDHPEWCDDLRTPSEEDCRWAVTTALERAVAILVDRLGSDIGAWRWGSLHTAPMGHATLTHIPVINWMTDHPLETPGGDHTPNRGQTRGPTSDDPFAHSHGAGLRAIYDLGDLDQSRFALAGGQSGHPLSPNYADRLRSWRNGRYFLITGRSGDIQPDDFARLILKPE